jgi:hypothetical protein
LKIGAAMEEPKLHVNPSLPTRLERALDAERNLFASEQTLLQLRRAEADNRVALYIALGGGAIEPR